MFEKRTIAALAGAAMVGLVGVGAYAANPEPVEVEVQFVAPITISEVSALRFGLVDLNMANGESLTIATDGTVSGDTGRLLNNDQGAADLTVGATAGELIDIVVGNINDGTYYTLSAFECNYNGNGASTDCEAGGGQTETSVASASLTIGVTMTKSGAPAAAGVDNGSFDVTVAYQ
jgi:hypothetical protein